MLSSCTQKKRSSKKGIKVLRSALLNGIRMGAVSLQNLYIQRMI